MPDFSRLTNTNITNTPFQMVVFGSHSPILEVELNEMQMLEIERFRTFAKAFIGNVMDSSTTVTKINDDEYSVSGVMIIDGYVVKIDNVTMSHPHITTSVAFAINEEILNGESNVTDYNGDTINNTIIDDRCGIETTKRKSLKLSIIIKQISAPKHNEIVIGGFMSGGGLSLNRKTVNLKDVVTSINNINNKIEDLKKSVSDGKRAIASAITEIGVSTRADATFNTMANNIKSISPSIIINDDGIISVVCGDITIETNTYLGGATSNDVEFGVTFTSEYGFSIIGMKQRNPLVPLIDSGGDKYYNFTLQRYGTKTIPCAYISGRLMIVICNTSVKLINCGEQTSSGSDIISTSNTAIIIQNISTGTHEYSVMAFGIEYI